MQVGLDCLDQIGRIDVHGAVGIIWSAVVLDPVYFPVCPNQDKGMTRLASINCPFEHIVGFGNGAVSIGEQRHVTDAELDGNLLQLLRRVFGDRYQANASVLEIGISLQIDDLLVARRSAIGHVKVEQDRLAFIFGQRDGAPIRSRQAEIWSSGANLQTSGAGLGATDQADHGQYG